MGMGIFEHVGTMHGCMGMYLLGVYPQVGMLQVGGVLIIACLHALLSLQVRGGGHCPSMR